MNEEYLDLLDENGEKTGEKKLKSLVHRDGNYHRAAHVWILNSNNELLIQKRSSNKQSHPNLWDISAAGHVSAGESSLEAAKREIEEELGIQIGADEIKPIFSYCDKTVQNNYTFFNNGFQDVFLVKKDLNKELVKVDSDEISETAFIPYKKLKKEIDNNNPEFVPHPTEYFKLFKYLDKKMYKVAVMIFENEKGEILMYLRDNKPEIPFPHYWDLIGGATEAGETHEEALVREVKEELGLDVSKKDYQFFKKYDCPTGDVCPNEKYVYISKLNKLASELTLYEGERLAFFNKEEIKKMKIANILKDVILDYLESRENK